jgi:phosphonate metabolism protein (transferase hexapeptide repeat family)
MPQLSAEAPFLHPDVVVVNSTIGAWCEVGTATRLQNSALGDYSYCDRFCDIANAQVGKFSNIASLVRIGATDHPLDRASLHHFMYRASYYWPDEPDEAAVFAARAARVTVIGHDTWLGHGAIVKPGLTIGHGAVVGSGAVVTKDVAPYTIVAGNPARVIRMRQPPEIAARMIALNWWDWDHARLRASLEDFRRMDAQAFLDAYGG